MRVPPSGQKEFSARKKGSRASNKLNSNGGEVKGRK